MATTKDVERLPSGKLKYRGETYPGYNKPRHSCDTAKDKFTARYWSCKAWQCKL